MLRSTGIGERVEGSIHIITHAFSYSRSMCESPYQVHWQREEGHCPNLVHLNSNATDTVSLHDNGIPVSIHWSPHYRRHYASLVHMWNDWYGEYYQADYPRLIVRFEDLLANASIVLEHIQQCAGADWKHALMVYVTQSP